MHRIGQSCQTPAVELKRRACTLSVYSVRLHTREPTQYLAGGRQQTIPGHLNHQMQFSISEGRILLFHEPQLLCLGVVAKGALGQVGPWMAPSLNRAVPKEVTAFQAQARGSQRLGS